MSKRVIDSFSNEYHFLSNFSESPVLYEGVLYPTVEHAYQAAKSLDSDFRFRVSINKSPATAKKMGRGVRLRPDWEDIKVDVMRYLLQRKFNHDDLREQLLETEDAELIEGNWWGDKFWGVCNGEGQNMLGKLLMEIREDIQAEVYGH